MSYEPMVEYEVTVRVHVPSQEPGPREWDWPGLVDMVDEDVQFVAQRVVRSYNRDLDPEQNVSKCRNCGTTVIWSLDFRRWIHDVPRVRYCVANFTPENNPTTEAEPVTSIDGSTP